MVTSGSFRLFIGVYIYALFILQKSDRDSFAATLRFGFTSLRYADWINIAIVCKVRFIWSDAISASIYW